MKTEKDKLSEAREEFVAQWGAMGGSWGINRTMAQVHALLLTTPHPLTTDDLMTELKISRGNAHSNLRELVNWGLVRPVIKKGERKDYYEAEKDVWKMFCIISRERRRRELLPALAVLKDCGQRTKDCKGGEAAAFNQQIAALNEFLEMADNVLTKVANSEKNSIIPWALKVLK